MFLSQRGGENVKVLNCADWCHRMTKEEGLKGRAAGVFDEFMSRLEEEGLIGTDLRRES